MNEILIAVLSVAVLLCVETVLLWDFILQLAGLNENLSEINCKWQKKSLKHFQRFFPKKGRSFKKVTPEYLYRIVSIFQTVLYILFFVSLINAIVCIVLFVFGVKFDIMFYCGVFTLTDMLISCGVLGIAYYVIRREYKKYSNEWHNFK